MSQDGATISEAAHWVAAYRTMETERPDALFRDPLAARLAGERGRDITPKMTPNLVSNTPKMTPNLVSNTPKMTPNLVSNTLESMRRRAKGTLHESAEQVPWLPSSVAG
jgi:O-methyltransferase involved in polyketide biosynthesis